MAAHTPGPWTVESGTNDYDIVVGNARLAGYVQKEADADLIAAAPELLAACKFARSVITTNGVFELSERLAVEKLDAAIAKAEGKS